MITHHSQVLSCPGESHPQGTGNTQVPSDTVCRCEPVRVAVCLDLLSHSLQSPAKKTLLKNTVFHIKDLL